MKRGPRNQLTPEEMKQNVKFCEAKCATNAGIKALTRRDRGGGGGCVAPAPAELSACWLGAGRADFAI
jgi:hypothetical protein